MSNSRKKNPQTQKPHETPQGRGVTHDWMAPVSEEAPCGVDLEYDPEFVVLSASVAARADAQYGDFVGTPEPVNWSDVDRDCRRLMMRSKDVRLAVLFTRCRTRLAAAAGLAEGLGLLAAWLASFPDLVHPQSGVDEDRTAALEIRMNALQSLTDTDGLIADLREIALTRSTQTRLQMRDVERAFAHPRPSDALAPDSVTRQLEELRMQQTSVLSGFDAALESLTAIEDWCRNHLSVFAPDLTALKRLLCHVAVAPGSRTVDNDPDKPYIAGRHVNQFHEPPWPLPANQALSGWMSEDLEGPTTNSVVTDDTPGKLQVQVASDHAQSRLVLGSNTRIDRRKGRSEARGEGFELATEAHGVARANLGMLVTTETRAGAGAPVKDMGETVQRLTQARELHEEMAQFAQQQKAQDAQVSQRDVTAAMKAQNDAIKGGGKSASNPSPEMTRPDLVLASAAGIAATASDSMHLASQNDHAVTAGRDVSIVSGRSWLASVRGAISFVTGLGIRLFAAKGKVEIQAQGDEMALASLKDFTISSTNGKIVITASQEVWIGAQGSYIRINGNGIDNVTPGRILEKCTVWDKPGAESMRIQQTLFESQKPLQFSQQVFLDENLFKPNGSTAIPVKYQFLDEAGIVLGTGLLDGGGKTLRAYTDVPQKISAVLDFNHGKWETLTYADKYYLSSNPLDKDDAGVFDYPEHENAQDEDSDEADA